MELLAPAGGFDQLQAACAFGADAVYLAAEKFGMRARAANFTLDELPQAVALAHDADVKVYVTCNVTIMEDDLAALPAYLEAVDAAGADALIIGDMGAFALAKKHAPHCRLHVSTQANVANAEAVRVWHTLGASRVVCAREMTLADIAAMRLEVPADLEIEAFVHGAQCMAVSGRCLISSYLTERSGNRGHCTQPCRWNYALEEEKRPGEFFTVEEGAALSTGDGTFIMNAMDLNMLAHIGQLEAAGVSSIKIEGRNKKAFYVATVVGAYRRALDALAAGALDDVLVAQLEDELRCVSHRPYSEGFYFGNPKQASDFDGYEQETLHVADVVGCKAAAAANAAAEGGADGGAAVSGANDSQRWTLTLRCRNRFEEGDEVEVIAPYTATRRLVVSHMRWLPQDKNGDLCAPEPVAIANRATDLYLVDSPFPVQEGSLVRMRTYRRSARHA